MIRCTPMLSMMSIGIEDHALLGSDGEVLACRGREVSGFGETRFVEPLRGLDNFVQARGNLCGDEL
jgi:hypothetical protein